MKTCDSCGRQAEEAESMTWVTSVENGRRKNYCETCAREHLRAIEGKLDSEWW
jgi:protein-arginine kinase activator protein McsA